MYLGKDVIELIFKYKKIIEDYEKIRINIFKVFKTKKTSIFDTLLDYNIFKEIFIEYKNELDNYNLIRYDFIDRCLHYSYINEGIIFDINKFNFLKSKILKIIKDDDNNVLIILKHKNSI